MASDATNAQRQARYLARVKRKAAALDTLTPAIRERLPGLGVVIAKLRGKADRAFATALVGGIEAAIVEAEKARTEEE